MQNLSAVENATVGVAAGTIEVTILQPILYFKNAAQQNLPLSLSPRVLYRGLTMSITNMSVLTGLQFPLTGMVTNAITGGEKRKLKMSEMIASGFVGGAISGLVCGPMELVMIQQQRFGDSLLKCPSRIIGETGGAGIMRGTVMSCGREGLFCAGYLGMGPAFTRELQESYGYDVGTAKFGGAVSSGVIAASLSHPMDTIKTCMQGDIVRKNYGTVGETASALYAESGLLAFFKGWHWRTGRMICAMFIMGECKDILSPLFFPHHFE